MRIGADIAERLMKFGVAALHISTALPRDPAGRHVALQLVRAATSAGANYEEARAAESKGDFIHKLGISAKEIRESGYWLTLINLSGWPRVRVDREVTEAQELAAILAASKRTARGR